MNTIDTVLKKLEADSAKERKKARNQVWGVFFLGVATTSVLFLMVVLIN